MLLQLAVIFKTSPVPFTIRLYKNGNTAEPGMIYPKGISQTIPNYPKHLTA